MSEHRGSGPKESVKKELWRRANGMCQMCEKELDVGTRGRVPTAQIAHIRALSDGGPRAVSELSIEERNSVGNLILLCPSCHDLVDKNEDEYPIHVLADIKTKQEARAAGLRQAGQTWRMRYATIDYLNLPRIALMPGTGSVVKAAEEVRLDLERPFREQGAKPGFFLAQIHPLFPVWDAQAVALTEGTVEEVRPGMYVSFEQLMRARNIGSLSGAPKEASWENDPQLVCSVGRRRVRIRFDPSWITTVTPVSDLKSAARWPVVYAGLGQVVGVSPTEIFVSARIFGQPQTPTSAMWDYLKESRGSGPESLSEADFVNEFSTLQQSPPYAVTDEERNLVLKAVALHFDEDLVIPRQIEREVFTQVLRVIPEFRRDVRVAVYSIPQFWLAEDGSIHPSDIAAQVLAGKPSLWKTMAVPAMATAIRHKNLAVARVEGISLHQAADLHAAVKEISSSYLGAVETDLDLEVHRRLYSFSTRYRLVGSDLHLLWSEMERAMAGDDIEDKIGEWVESGLFCSVDWEEGPGPHDAEILELGHAFTQWLRDSEA